MADIEIINDKSLEFKDFFTSDIDNTYVYEIGWHIVILLFLPIVAIKRFWKENKVKKEYILFLILGLFCLFMSTKYFPWEPLEKYLELIQFPWRMLVFANFFLSIVCAINVQIVIKNFKFKDNVFFAIICILYLLTLRDFIPIEKEITNIEEWEIGNLVTNKNQAIAGMGKGEYLPVKANESREYIMERGNEIYVLEGKAEIENYSKNGQNLSAKITTKDSILELPYIYYPGYIVTLNGEKQEILETENGFIGIVLKDSGTLEVEYTGTVLMNISKIISILGVIGFITYIIYTNKHKSSP